MNIFGIGTDIVSVDRIKKSLLCKKSNADNKIQMLKKIKEWK